MMKGMPGVKNRRQARVPSVSKLLNSKGPKSRKGAFQLTGISVFSERRFPRLETRFRMMVDVFGFPAMGMLPEAEAMR